MKDMNHIDNKDAGDLLEKVLQAFFGALFWVCGKWLIVFSKWIVKKYKEEKRKPLVIYMRRATVRVLVFGAVLSGMLSTACIIYIAYNFPGGNDTKPVISMEEIKFLQHENDSLKKASK